MNNKRILKSISVFLLFIFLTEIVVPPVYALTSGPTQPEVFGNQPTESSENVSMVTGGFNYSIPITSIPEYPMAIGYSSGLGMDQEASAFGYGFNGFSGAIGRNMNGIPDDLNGGLLKYYNYNQTNWNASLTIEVAAGLPPGGVVTLGLSASMTGGYDNYTGAFGAVSFGIGVGVASNLTKNIKLGVGLGIGLSSDSRYGASASIGAGVSLSRQNSKGNYNGIVGLGIGAQLGSPNTLSASATIFDLPAAAYTFAGDHHSGNSGSALQMLAPLSSISSNIKIVSVGINIGAIIPLGSSPIFVGGGASYFYANYCDDKMDKNSYGFMHMANVDRQNRNHISDFTIEGENAFSDEDRTNPSYLQKDYFVANCGGLSGSMQLASDEHVVVSRNYQRSNELNATLLSVKQKRKEVERWDRIKKAGVNRDFDVLSLFKKKESVDSKDFDKSIFNESEIANTEFDKMTRRPTMRFRGDMAGEFNMSSNNYQDEEPNQHWLDPVMNSTARKVTLTTVERQMPLFMPRVSSADAFDKGNGMTRSSKIDYYTVDDVLKGTSTEGASTCSLPSYDPNGTSNSNVCPNYAKFSECYYSHYTYNQNVSRSKLSPMSESKDKKKLFNIVNHLSSLNHQTNASNPYFKDLIADIRVRKTDGSTYIFNLPAFAKKSKSIQLAGKGVNPPVIEDNTYHSFKEGNKFRDRFKTEVEQDFMYPYAWMLTAIVGSDYIDLDDIPGPSDGDLGYWVKFKYVKTSDNYTWRSPYKGMDHMSNALHLYSDDAYMATSGTKEVYCLERIESKSHVSKYNYDERQDGVSANNYVNGEAKNTATGPGLPNSSALLGNQYLFAVKSIDLYKKYAQQNNSRIAAVPNEAEIFGKKQSSTAFYYDYSLCPNTPNNIKACGENINLDGINYFSPETSVPTTDKKTGKLTLRKVVQKEYDEDGAEHILPSTQLFYAHHLSSTVDEVNTFNPEYDNRQVDIWGNYCKAAKMDVRGVSCYSNYTEISKKHADKNAQAFTLKKINLPSGGTMEINYEANGYGSVQDKQPYVMRRCKNVAGTDTETDGISTINIKVDVTDIVEQNSRLQSVMTNGRVSTTPDITQPIIGTNLPTNEVFKSGLSTYMEFGFYQKIKNLQFPDQYDPSNIFLATGHQSIKNIIDNSLSYDDKEDRYYVTVTLGAKDIKSGDNIIEANPVFQQPINFAYGVESIQMKMVKEIRDRCNEPSAIEEVENKFKSMEKDDAWDAVKKVANNVKDYFGPKEKEPKLYNDCFGLPGRLFFEQYSYIRTNILKEKYTGTRVKSIKMADNFAYASNTAAGTDNANEYITNYFYDNQYNGTGASEGVSTIEPGGGEASVININNVLGAGFYPAPSICNSKVAVENNNIIPLKQSTKAGDVISRNKGKTIYHFYTCKDDGLRFEENFKRDPVQLMKSANGRFDMLGLTLWKKIKIFKKRFRIPYGWLPYFIFWKRLDNYQMGAYSYTDLSDMYGKPKKLERIPASGGEPVYVQEYNYFKKNEGVSVLKNKNHNDVSIGKPGRFDQTWSEANFSKEGELNRYNLIPIFYFAESKRKFNYTNMKQTYIAPLMKEVVSKTGEGITEKVTYSNFDYATGMPLETKTTDSYGNTKIARSTPAYWSKPEMGEDVSAVTYNNSATQSNMTDVSSASYVYLNDAGEEGQNLLSASVTYWAKVALSYAPTILPSLTNYDTQNTKQVTYKKYSSQDLKDIIESKVFNTGLSRPFVQSAYYTNKIPYYRPISSYVYQTSLNADGTFSIANLFNNSTQNQSDTQWKEISRATMFHANGQVVESKDILDKYASSYVGYSGMATHYSVVNAAYQSAVYDGAENEYTFKNTSTPSLSDKSVEDVEPRLTLGAAKVASVINKGEATTTSFTLDGSKLSNGGASVINVCIPTSQKPALNVSFAKIKATFNVSAQSSLNRTLQVSLNENNEVRIITNYGEPFTGFYLVKGSCEGGTKYSIIFDNAIVDIAATGSITTPYEFTLDKNVIPKSCPGGAFTYSLPKGDMVPEAHTGKSVFLLKSKSKGTLSKIEKSTNSTEFFRKYKALVWVYNGSPSQTKLVLKSSTTNMVEVTKNNPYMVSGNWLLLRAEIEVPGADDTAIEAWVENDSEGGSAIYDDFCVLPYQAEMNAMIYDQAQGKLVAKLNKDHIATYYLYDGRGRVKEVKTELVNKGSTTVKKYLYNDQKKDQLIK